VSLELRDLGVGVTSDAVPQSVARRTLLVVVPAFNEEASVARVIKEVRDALPGSDILIVDDASVDRTREEALSAGALVATLPFHLGVGGAMRAGYRFARRERYDRVVQVDGDGQHDPREVFKLLQMLDEADVVVGARFAGEGSYSVRGPRRWAMLILSAVLSEVAGTRLTDTTSGFRACNARAIALFAAHYPAEYLGDTLESLVVCARAGLRVRQAPVRMRARAAGRPSCSPITASIYLMRACFALLFALIRRWDVYSTTSSLEQQIEPEVRKGTAV
jgi:glycosyltransferase involved in cell wall biosynthesis